MSDTAKLKLPLLATSQAQKEITHNAALLALDVLTMPSVINATTAAPPASPAEGDAYIVAAGATGAWAGREGDIAAWYSGWRFHDPAEGWTVWDRAVDRMLVYDSTAWVNLVRLAKPPAAAAALVNGWANYGAPHGPAQYRKSAEGLVFLEGVVHLGPGNSVIFTLPVGHRPASRILSFGMDAAGTPRRVDVLADGSVLATSAYTTVLSIDGMSFYAAG